MDDRLARKSHPADTREGNAKTPLCGWCGDEALRLAADTQYPDPPTKGTTYRKKPVVVEAVQLIGGNDEGAFEDFAARHPEFKFEVDDDNITIDTLEGQMRADVGDWIICGVKGEFYPCKPDIFEATYEPA